MQENTIHCRVTFYEEQLKPRSRLQSRVEVFQPQIQGSPKPRLQNHIQPLPGRIFDLAHSVPFRSFLSGRSDSEKYKSTKLITVGLMRV